MSRNAIFISRFCTRNKKMGLVGEILLQFLAFTATGNELSLMTGLIFVLICMNWCIGIDTVEYCGYLVDFVFICYLFLFWICVWPFVEGGRRERSEGTYSTLIRQFISLDSALEWGRLYNSHSVDQAGCYLKLYFFVCYVSVKIDSLNHSWMIIHFTNFASVQ
jgi:hypothetical protein